jgi:hypothetical protein
MLKKVLAVTALAGAAALTATPANAAGACVDLYLNVNGQELVNQQVCTPPVG